MNEEDKKLLKRLSDALDKCVEKRNAESFAGRRQLIEELLWHVRKLAQPIDFADLQNRGLISKEGDWYRVPKIHDLPDHAGLKISSLRLDAKGVSVQFWETTKFEKIARRIERQKERMLKEAKKYTPVNWDDRLTTLAKCGVATENSTRSGKTKKFNPRAWRHRQSGKSRDE